MLRLDRSNPNATIGLILLNVLGVFVLPTLAEIIFWISAAGFRWHPCERLPAANDLAAHQSTLARAVKDPLSLSVALGEISADGGLTVGLSVSNHSLGAAPIAYQPDNIVVAEADDESNGYGLIVNPAPASGLNERNQPPPTSYDEADIRLLGPRQKCVHVIELTVSDAMIAAGGTVQAWYRMTIAASTSSRVKERANLS